MADGKIEIETEIKNEGKITKGLQKIADKLNKIGNNSTVKGIKNIGQAFQGITSVAGLVAGAIGKVTQSLTDCVNATVIQEKSERQLEIAARTNPYLNSEGVKSLKAYAGELQKVSEVGDEQLLPLMAELATSGRTQAEIQSIMAAAVDAQASGLISLEGAVQSLNRSYEGEVGQLGRIIPSLKNLTKEELARGAAVEKVANSYKGLATATADARVQAANQWGDAKESIGKLINNDSISYIKEAMGFTVQMLADTLNDFLIEHDGGFEKKLIELQANAQKYAYEAALEMGKDRAAALGEFTDYIDFYLDKLSDEQFEKVAIYAKYNIDRVGENFDKERAAMSRVLALSEKRALKQEETTRQAKYQADAEKESENSLKKQIENNKKLNEQIRKKKEYTEDDLKKVKELDAQNVAYETELKNREKRRDELRDSYDALIAKEKELIKYERSIGTEIDAQTEAQRLLNVASKAYVDMMKDPSFRDNSGNYIHEVNARADISQWGKTIDNEALKKKWADMDVRTAEEEIRDEIALMDQEFNTLINLTEFSEQQKYEIREKWERKTEELYKKLAEAEAESTNETLDQVKNMFALVGQYVDNLAQTLNTVSDMVAKNAENRATVQNAELEKQYAAGLVTEEDYYNQKEKIEKDAAKKAYKVQLAAWGVQVAQATASIAQGMLQTLGDATIPSTAAKIAMMSTIGALGAAQLATVIANKPTLGYASGGIVGATMGGDDTIALRRGEMVLNANQQKTLWSAINGGGVGGGLNVQIKNYMGDSANVSTQLQGNTLTMTVKKIVADGMNNGEFSGALTNAENLQNGVSYTS